MTTNPSHQTTQKRRTRREADSDKVTRLPLSKSAERLLATLLQRDPPAPHNRLARFLHEPVLRRLLSILESPAGVARRQEAGLSRPGGNLCPALVRARRYST